MTRLDYPETATGEVVDDYHGTKVADPYRWLEDTDAPETEAWIEAQNALTQGWLGEVAEREAIRERLTALWDHPRLGVPFRRGERWFQLRNSGLQNQDVLYVMDAPDADGEVLLDPNLLSTEGTVALTGTAITDDGRLLAYATSAAGSDWMTWRVRDVATGEDRGDLVVWSKFSGAAWLPDGSGFFYGRYDAPEEGKAYESANRDHRLWLHRLGTDQADDELIYERPDNPDLIFAPIVTEDGRWLVVHVAEGTDRRNRLAIADLSGGTGEEARGVWERRRLDEGGAQRRPLKVEVEPFLDELEARYDLVGSDDDTLYLLTDADAPRRRIIAVDAHDVRREAWREVVPESEDTLEYAQHVGGMLVAGYLHHAQHVLRRFGLDGEARGEVELPGIGAIEGIAGRAEDPDAYFAFTSFSQPPSVYRHELASGETTLLSAPEIDIDPAAFVTEQVFVTSADGTRVPMFLVRRRDLEPWAERHACAIGEGHPTLLWGYGGFGISVPPAFRVAWHVWVERGGLLAVPNLRGGGEYGAEWHDAGRGAHKQNVFDDCVAAAEWLIDNGWTRPERLAISGASNGGLLAGACMTQRPDLFGAAVPEVGVLDMLRFHRFTIGWAWTTDYGSADEPEEFATLYAYSPLHNLRPGTSYPATLVVTGDHDDRVVPGHSFKFAAALQAAQGGNAPTLIRIQTQAGHGVGKPTRIAIDERTDVLAFLHRALDVSSPKASVQVASGAGPESMWWSWRPPRTWKWRWGIAWPPRVPTLVVTR